MSLEMSCIDANVTVGTWWQKNHIVVIKCEQTLKDLIKCFVNFLTTLVIVVMTTQQECSRFPLVEKDCTISPPISWYRVANMAPSAWWWMMWWSAVLLEMKAAIVDQMSPKLCAVLWAMLPKVRRYSYFKKWNCWSLFCFDLISVGWSQMDTIQRNKERSAAAHRKYNSMLLRTNNHKFIKWKNGNLKNLVQRNTESKLINFTLWKISQVILYRRWDSGDLWTWFRYNTSGREYCEPFRWIQWI